jgi:transcriptional regulator with XRE-family HTH domain
MEKLKDKRLSLHLTQQQLADNIGVEQKDVSRWETGVVKPSMNNLMKLAVALHCDISDLI